MYQLLLHLLGDYILQSHWMAQNKTKRHWPALCHAFAYSLPFLFAPYLLGWLDDLFSVRESLIPRITWQAFAFILGTHFVIDRYRLARHVVWLKNFLSPRYSIEGWTQESDEGRVTGKLKVPNWHPWASCDKTGYHGSIPDWLAVWLLIAADNTLHLLLNWAALRYL